MPTVPTPHDHALPVETLDEKAARLSAGQPIVVPVRYEVGLLPEGDVNRRAFLLYVEYRGEGLWSVHDGHGQYDDAGAWRAGLRPCTCDEQFGTHRFALDDALALAAVLAPNVTVNGRTAAETYRARRAR
ncbi:hypothetical protein [Streptomyces xanthophaeus]|uniref:hypothetical protein n=1 Tax=Streptomyces xanthophaeus TaxID=67385 RepID=UPI0026483F49|nr:hypothetical protein [Streptomyces xanthophaeus]WKD36543.1 hypothetical protein KO717_34490 [Streptomyces xanthophaeus]